MNEFDLIRRYFDRAGHDHAQTVLGIGDDAAIIRPGVGQDLVVCTDTLISGRHFPEATAPADIGYKALAVNLSDLAAMGARPRAFLLNLSMPDADARFLEEFADGLFELADAHQVQLLGGDTTRGPLSITITAWGELPQGLALRRSGARPGDLVVCGGVLGGAALALEQGANVSAALRRCLDRPEPQLELGQALLTQAHAAIDVSDGLAADLGHLMESSGLAAVIDPDALPAHPALATLGPDKARELVLSGGDDYVLCFTMSEAQWPAFRRQYPALPAPFGRVIEGSGLYLGGAEGKLEALTPKGYRHF